jgi:hypothetical protein
VEIIVDATFDGITGALGDVGRARVARNPRTGETVEVEEK